MDKNLRYSNKYKTRNGAIMNEGTRNQLEAKVRKMLDHLVDQAKAKDKQPITQSGMGNIIRRRPGGKEKRFSAHI